MKKEDLRRENDELRRQLAEAEDTLAAIREGQVDAIVMNSAAGPQVFSLTGAETAYRLAFETMAEAAISTTADGIILFCNSRFSEFVATPMEQLLGHNIAGFVSSEDREVFRTLLHQCRDQSVKHRITLCGPGGVRRPVHLTGTALHQGDGISLCLVAADLSSLESSAQQIELLQQAQSELRESRRAALNIMEDAQEARREAEQAAAALQQSKATLLSFYDSAPFLMGIAELNGDKTVIVSGNRALAKFFEKRPDELPGLTGPELSSAPPAQRMWVENYRRCQESGVPVHFEYESPHADHVYWLSATAAFIGIGPNDRPRFSFVIEDITERKRTEAALHESEERFRGIVETAEEGIATHALDGTITYVNKRMANMLGYSPEEVIGRSSLDFVDDAEKDAVIKARKHVQEQGGFSREHRLCRKDGSILWTLSNISPRHDDAGNFIGYLAMHTDITARKQTEDKLRESELRFSSAFRSSPIGINMFRFSDGCSVDVNDAFLSIVEYSRDELIGRSSTELNLFVDPNQRTVWMQALREQGSVRNLDLQIRSKSGRIVETLFSLVKIELAGEVMGLVMAIDVTERKRAEQMLLVAHAETVTERNRLQAVMGALPVGVAILDGQGGRVQANKAFEDVWGNPIPDVDEVSDYAAYKAWWSDTGQLVQPEEWAAAQVIKTGEPVVGQVMKIQRFDGKYSYVVNSGAPIFDDVGRLQGCAVAIMDITAEKKTEDALKESEKRYRELVQYAPAGIYEIDFRTRKFMSVNDAMCQMSGYTREELLGMEPLTILDQDSQKLFMQRLQMWLEGNLPQENVEYVVSRKDGSKIDVLLNVTFTRDVLGIPLGASVIGYDITERKKAEKNLELINRTLKALSNSNQAMMRAESEADLLNNVCRIIVEDCGYAMVWVGYAENDADKSVRPVASAGFEAGYLETLKITWADTERGHGPTGTSVRTGKTSRCRNMLTDPQFAPWREQALERGYASSMVVPLLQNDQSFGAITIYARQPDVFSDEEEKLLIQLAGDLAYGIQTMRLREALRTAYVDLEQRVTELQTLMDVAPVAIGIGLDPQGNVVTANRVLSEWLGAPEGANVSLGTPKEQRTIDYQVFRDGQLVRTEDLPVQYAALNAQRVRNDELTLMFSDGKTMELLANADPLFDAEGCVRGSIATYIDISERKRAEDELRAAHNELEERVRERTAELEQRNIELQILSAAEHEQHQLAEALVKAALVLNKSLDQDEVLKHILEQIQNVIPYQFATITLLDGESFYDASYQGTLASSESDYGIKRRFPLKDFPILKKMRQTREPVLLIDTAQDPDWGIVNNLTWSRSFLSAPLLVEKQVIGFVNLFSVQPHFFTQSMCERLVAFAAHAAAAIQNAWLFERVRAGSERLQSLSRRLVEIQENERHYIARELHDEAGQMLASLIVHLRVLEKSANQPELVLKKIAEMEASLNEVFDSLHRIAVALRPATLDHLGLVAALHQYIDALGEKQHLEIRFNSEKVQERLSANVETVLYRIAQESLTNVMRHAQATEVDVVLTMRDNKVILIIEDDGIGFDPNANFGDEHLGLFGMRERIETVNGKLVIESAPGKGTTVMAEVEI